MSNITYGIVKEEHLCGNINRISYGIAAYTDFENDGTATVIALVSDITSDKQSVEDLVKRCNSSKLSVCHLNDVVEDLMAI